MAQVFGLAQSSLDVIGGSSVLCHHQDYSRHSFFLIMTPIGVVKRLLGWDPLDRRSGSRGSYWKPYSERQRDPRHYEKMY